jgi:hypothetical protein
MLREIDSGPHTNGIEWPSTLTDNERLALKRRLDTDGEVFLKTDEAGNLKLIDPSSVATPSTKPEAKPPRISDQ